MRFSRRRLRASSMSQGKLVAASTMTCMYCTSQHSAGIDCRHQGQLQQHRLRSRLSLSVSMCLTVGTESSDSCFTSKPVCACECDTECHPWVNAREHNMLPLPISSTKDSLDLHQDLATIPPVHYAKLWEALPVLGKCKRDRPASSAHLLLDC